MAREILAEAFAGRASSLMLDYTQQGVAVQTMIDGVWIPNADKQREIGDSALETFKLLSGLNPQDRQSRQEGTFVAEYDGVRYATIFASQGTSGGERVLLHFEDKKIRFYTFDELGMRAKLQEQVVELLGARKGIILFTAAPGGGLRSTVDVALQTCDRYVREFATVEAQEHPYQSVENVPVTTYSEAEGQSPADVLVSLFRKDPNVVVVRDLVNAETVSLMCQEVAKHSRLMIGSIRAKDAAEALLRVMALDVPPAEFAEAITGVIGQRLVRKLCDACKEAFAPTPQMLQQLGIPAGRVQAFYRPPQPDPEQPKEPCQACGAIGYLGRTAIFEVLAVGGAVRKALAAGAKLAVVRQAARKDGMKSFQEEGILLVAKGVTSLPELMRVLKQ
jgi:type II secretory ATPase GspE/PulE/Tfp pilus assembly ATPase PilB-like protein